jgi:ABC-type antimicrobial peptide transport system permease subunit
MATERIMATLGGLFGVLALVVAGIGVFGLLAFEVSRRTNELGVRMALGADRARLVAIVLRQAAVMVGCGVAIGALGAIMATGLAGVLLYGVSPSDPGVFAVAAAILAVSAVLAAALPAWRASRVDPIVALRHE